MNELFCLGFDFVCHDGYFWSFPFDSADSLYKGPGTELNAERITDSVTALVVLGPRLRNIGCKEFWIASSCGAILGIPTTNTKVYTLQIRLSDE